MTGPKAYYPIVEALLSHRHADKLFFVTTAFIFLPFLTTGKVLFSDTDSVFTHYPNIFFGWDSIRGGGLALWNPYIFAGTDFAARMHNHMLHPINWVLLLVPREYVLHGLTVLYFVEYVAVGYFAYAIARLYLAERSNALFFGVCVQLSGWTWFSTMTTIGTPLTVATIIGIYLLLTYGDGRSRALYFVGLTLSFFTVLFMGHIGYIFAFGLPLVIVFAIRLGVEAPSGAWRGLAAVVILAGIFAGAMALTRLWPIVQALLFENMGQIRNMSLPQLSGNVAYMILPGFIPEALGYHLGEAADLMNKLGIAGRHTQFHSLLYFGIVPTILVFLALSGRFGRLPMLAAFLFVATALTQTFGFVPVSDVLGMLFVPLYHEIAFRVLFTFFFLTSLLLALRSIATPSGETGIAGLRGFIVFAAVIVAMTLALAARLGGVVGGDFSGLFLLIKALVAATLVGAVLVAWRLPDTVDGIVKVNLIVICAGIVTLIGLGVYAVASGLFWRQWLVLYGYLTEFSAVGWAACVVWLARAHVATDGFYGRAWMVPVAAMVVIGLVLLAPLPMMGGERTTEAVGFAIAVGIIRFGVLALCALEILALCMKNRISRRAFILLALLLTLGDLLSFNKLYALTGSLGFAEAQRIFPGLGATLPPIAGDLDLDQYRVNRPHNLYRDHYGRVLSSGTSMYRIGSYGGVQSDVSRNLYDLIAAFEPNSPKWFHPTGILAVAENERLLDLLGVGYEARSSGEVTVRPDALARMSLFRDFEVVGEANGMLKRLGEASFHPATTILIDRAPGFNRPQADGRRRFEVVQYRMLTTEHLTAEVVAHAPSVLLFNDTFSPYWRVRIDGISSPILRANYNFMAVAVPPGASRIEFRFKPQPFLTLSVVSLILGMLVVLVGGWGLFARMRRRTNSA